MRFKLIFREFFFRYWVLPVPAGFTAVGYTTLFSGKHFLAKAATFKICNLSLYIAWFIYNADSISDYTGSNGGMIHEHCV